MYPRGRLKQEWDIYTNRGKQMAEPKSAKQKVTFSYNAPEAKSVLLAGEFTNWQHAPLELKQNKAGAWKIAVSLPRGRYQYRFVVDGEWRDDPQCIHRQPNGFGGQNCVCIVDGQ